MSLQTESLLALYDMLDPEKKDEFVNKIIFLCSDSKLRTLRDDGIYHILEKKRRKFLTGIIKYLGFEEEFNISWVGFSFDSLSKEIIQINIRVDDNDKHVTKKDVYAEMYLDNDKVNVNCFSRGRFTSMEQIIRKNCKEIFHAMSNYYMSN